MLRLWHLGRRLTFIVPIRGPFCTKITPVQSVMSLFMMKIAPSTNYLSEKAPKIISRYPSVDHEDFDFPLSLNMFVQPSGWHFLTFSSLGSLALFLVFGPLGSLYRKTPGSVQILTFILTNNDGSQTFGISIQFYEEIDSIDPVRILILFLFFSRLFFTAHFLFLFQFPTYQLKSLCLLSLFPFYGKFPQLLVYLHSLIEKPSNIPIERVITNIFESKPPPPPPPFDPANPFLITILSPPSSTPKGTDKGPLCH